MRAPATSLAVVTMMLLEEPGMGGGAAFMPPRWRGKHPAQANPDYF
jgi:hypothetical protein